MIFLPSHTIKEEMHRYSSVKEINSSAMFTTSVASNEQRYRLNRIKKWSSDQSIDAILLYERKSL